MNQESRYDRQIRFAPIGQQGQERLARAKVLVLGVGALGTVAAELLARAGIGTLRIVDRDTVEWSNLQRQSLFDEDDARLQLAKADAAANKLRQINSQIEIQPHACDVHPGNITSLLGDIDLTVDATDNFPTRFLLNDAAFRLRKPWVHGGCVGSQGQVGFFTGTGHPCFRCIVPDPPQPGSVQTCDTAGVVNAATHLIASLQVAQAIRWLVGDPSATMSKLQTIDVWTMRFTQIDLGGLTPTDCPVCCHQNFEFLEGSKIQSPIALCGRDAVQIPAGQPVDFERIVPRWQSIGTVQSNPFLLRLSCEGISITLFRDGRAIINGTNDIAKAKSIYARFVGE
ncbi:MAG: ThiF family adenylyltransferase [Pirellulaceae bacterium]